MTVLTSFTLLIFYSLLLSGAHGKITNPSESSAVSSPNELLKRPIWYKKVAARHLKPLGAYTIYRKEFQPDADPEFVDDAVNEVEKRLDDYGHIRFDCVYFFLDF